jgi:phosphoribosyl 1,2-cyclic phosphodiesterase
MGINLKCIPISHDKKGFGYIFEYNNITLAYITDTGMIHSKYHEYFKNKNVYLLESNHDVEMEMNGTKDEMTKIRNIGDEGHLSNEECAMYLSHFVGDNTKYVMLMHLSEHDNTRELAFNTNRVVLSDIIKLYVSFPNELSDIIEI